MPEDLLCRFAPDIGPTAQACIGCEAELLVCEHAERRNDVFLEILVLIIAPHDDEVRLEGIDLFADLPEGAEDARLVRPVRRDALIIAPFQSHRLRPVLGISHTLRYTAIAVKHSRQRPRFVFFRYQPRWIVCRAYAQDLCHDLSPPSNGLAACRDATAP
jgi:hypothetical protein